MNALPTPKWSRRREPADRVLRGAGRLARWAAFAVAALTLLTFVAAETAQACPEGNEPASLVTQNAAQVVAKQPTVASSFVKPAIKIKKTICCDGKSDCGHACAGAHCAACLAGLIAEGWTNAQGLILHVAPPRPQLRLSSIQLDTEFRPPRVAL